MGPSPKEVRVLITVVENKVGKSRKKGNRVTFGAVRYRKPRAIKKDAKRNDPLLNDKIYLAKLELNDICNRIFLDTLSVCCVFVTYFLKF